MIRLKTFPIAQITHNILFLHMNLFDMSPHRTLKVVGVRTLWTHHRFSLSMNGSEMSGAFVNRLKCLRTHLAFEEFVVHACHMRPYCVHAKVYIAIRALHYLSSMLVREMHSNLVRFESSAAHIAKPVFIPLMLRCSVDEQLYKIIKLRVAHRTGNFST